MARIRNYTSNVPAESSIAAIEDRLVRFGASNISKQYDAGLPIGIVFTIKEPKSGKDLTIELPASVEKVAAKLSLGKRKDSRTVQKIAQQAKRTAWRLILDWVDVQLSLIAMDLVEPLQVFMPYVLMQNGDTFYERIASQGFKALTYQPKEGEE
jgi:hypothetical protein